MLKTILFIYIIIINLFGLLLMGMDKRKAVRGRWRIPEKTLFLTAVLGGSIGIFTGMYLFRHKTRKLRFTIGIPVILVLQILFIIFFTIDHRERAADPSTAVSSELDLIQNLDADTIQNFISYEHLMNTPSASADIGPETTEAVNLFFKNFQYHLLSEDIKGNTAAVTAEIINIDTKALAIDLCKTLTAQSFRASTENGTPKTLNEYYILLKETLTSHRYDLVVSNAHFHLRKEGQQWIIQSDETLQDELVSGFISWMNDPFLLTPQDVLSIYLDEFKSFTPDEWITYLKINDIFSTGSDTYAKAIDQAYAGKLAEYFSYRTDSCTISGDMAVVDLTITNIDMPAILSSYRDKLLGYAHTVESITSDEAELADASASYLLESLNESSSTAEIPISVQLENNGHSWQPEISDELTNALLGNITQALDTFQGL